MPRERASGLWRSADMVRLDIIMQREVLHDTIFSLGLLGTVHVIDLNADLSAFSRPYTADIQQCDQLERKILSLAAALDAAGVVPDDGPQGPLSDSVRCDLRAGLSASEAFVDAATAEVSAANASLMDLRREMNYRAELALLRDRLRGPADPSAPHVRGVVAPDRAEALFAVAHRLTRGHAIVECDGSVALLLDPATGARCVPRTAFTVFLPTPAVRLRFERIAAGLGVELRGGSAGAKAQGLRASSGDDVRSAELLDELHERALERLRTALRRYARRHKALRRAVRVERAVLAAMNRCAAAGTTCTASVWVAARHEERLRDALVDAVHVSAGDVASVAVRHSSQAHPPTAFEINGFTECFQGIVDSYGMARYKEVNPGVFTIVTFPYLFGIMYGDIGHGVLLVIAALYLVAMEPRWRGKQRNEILSMLLGGRYLLLMMGLFSIYMGMLYNDFFGFSIGMFHSAYKWPPVAQQNGTVHPLEPNGTLRPAYVYPAGLDVAWTGTENKLEFYNSVKMKCAIIVGVVQMLTGNILSLLNHVYYRETTKIVALFLPEVLFLLCTFGYMSVLIILKWCTRWDNTSEAPSILETMTNFFLQPGSVTQPLYKGQDTVQIVLLSVAFAMVPVMLLVMPLVESYRHRRRTPSRSSTDHLRASAESPLLDRHRVRSSRRGTRSHAQSVFEASPYTESSQTSDACLRPSSTDYNLYRDDEVEALPEFQLSEVVIHYTIHTIEYVLGCVSNTASYLRLWALSLAHAQLSEVFFNFAVVKVLSIDTTGVFIAASVAVWLVVTLAVLVGMEALSAFLHALRLHWVEFNNKFYVGDGFALNPLNLLEEMNG